MAPAGTRATAGAHAASAVELSTAMQVADHRRLMSLDGAPRSSVPSAPMILPGWGRPKETPLEGASAVQPTEPESAATCGLDVRVDGLLAAHAVPRLCEQLVILVDCAGVGGSASISVSSTSLTSRPIDALARLALAARTAQREVTVRTTQRRARAAAAAGRTGGPGAPRVSSRG